MFTAKIGDCNVFFHDDPRADAFEGEVSEVDLIYELEADEWPHGTDEPEPWLGVKKLPRPHFQVFRSRAECEAAGYFPMGTQFLVVRSWKEWEAKT